MNRNITTRSFITAATSAAVVVLTSTAFAQQGGAADEAKAMLAKAVAAVKADKAKALDMFNKGEGGFLDRDLYPFCANVSDGKLVAIGNSNAKRLLGVDVRTVRDTNGKAFGLEQFAAAQKPEGELTEVSYMFPKPGRDMSPAPKVGFTTRVGDLICGVGYYKPKSVSWAVGADRFLPPLNRNWQLRPAIVAAARVSVRAEIFSAPR
jgi:hypothetical protein